MASVHWLVRGGCASSSKPLVFFLLHMPPHPLLPILPGSVATIILMQYVRCSLLHVGAGWLKNHQGARAAGATVRLVQRGRPRGRRRGGMRRRTSSSHHPSPPYFSKKVTLKAKTILILLRCKIKALPPPCCLAPLISGAARPLSILRAPEAGRAIILHTHTVYSKRSSGRRGQSSPQSKSAMSKE